MISLCRKFAAFNLVDFPVNFIKQFFPVSSGVSTKFHYRNSYRIIVYITYYQEYCISYSRKCWFFMQINLWRWAIPKICVFNSAILVKSRKFDAREIYMFYGNSSVKQFWRVSIIWNILNVSQLNFVRFTTIRHKLLSTYVHIPNIFDTVGWVIWPVKTRDGPKFGKRRSSAEQFGRMFSSVRLGNMRLFGRSSAELR